MEVIGENLKASREEKGISLLEVSEDLDIKVSDLENIENWNRSAFNDVYALREYLSSYSKYLGLDVDAIIDEFNEYMFESTSKIPNDVIERISKQKEKEESSKPALSPYTQDLGNYNLKSKKVKIILIITIVAILLIIAGLLLFKNNYELVLL